MAGDGQHNALSQDADAASQLEQKEDANAQVPDKVCFAHLIRRVTFFAAKKCPHLCILSVKHEAYAIVRPYYRTKPPKYCNTVGGTSTEESDVGF